METGFRHNFRRFSSTGTTAGVTLATALLVFPGSTAAWATDSLVSGDCAATVRGEHGRPLALDADVAVHSSGRADVGLAAKSKASLSLPVREAVNGLGLDEIGPVTGAAGEVCESGQQTVNGLVSSVQEALPGSGAKESDSNDPQSGGYGGPSANSPDSTHEPQSWTSESSATSTPDAEHVGSGNSPARQEAGAPPFAAAEWVTANADRVISSTPQEDVALPPAAAVAPHTDTTTQARNRQTQAVHNAGAPHRLPLLLAVAALVLVGAALAHTWLRRGAVRS